jgi:alkylhydroperoxidase family enzyme
MGTIFRGPGGALALNQQVMSEDAATFGEAWHAAIDYAMAVGKIPSEVDDEQRAALAQHFSREDEEAVVLVATAMGFLNRCMDTLGTVLEWQMLESGTAHLSESGWHPGAFYDPEADAEIMAQDRAVGDERVGPLALVGLLRGCVAYDREALRGIPKRGEDVYALVAETLGFVPYYLERLRRDAARRAFAHMLVERLQPEGVAVPAWLKHAMCFISAKHANNPVLAAHFAFLAHRGGATREQLRAAMDREGSFEPPHASAIALAHATAEHPTAMSAELVQMLVASHSPESVIELVLVLAIEASLQRYTATYPAYRYEPPIAAFAQEHGAYLGLDTALG